MSLDSFGIWSHIYICVAGCSDDGSDVLSFPLKKDVPSINSRFCVNSFTAFSIL